MAYYNDEPEMPRSGSVIGGGTKMAYSEASVAADFKSMLERLHKANSLARNIAQHAGKIGDVAHGQGSESGTESCRPLRSGLIGSYEDAIDDLFEILVTAESNVARIGNAIPQ